MPDGQGKIGIPNLNDDRQSLRMLGRDCMTNGRARNLKEDGRRSLLRWMRWRHPCKKGRTPGIIAAEKSMQRESELYKMVQIAAIDQRQIFKERSMLKDALEKLRKEREEENEARALLEEIQPKLGRGARQSL